MGGWRFRAKVVLRGVARRSCAELRGVARSFAGLRFAVAGFLSREVSQVFVVLRFPNTNMLSLLQVPFLDPERPGLFVQGSTPPCWCAFGWSWEMD